MSKQVVKLSYHHENAQAPIFATWYHFSVLKKQLQLASIQLAMEKKEMMNEVTRSLMEKIKEPAEKMIVTLRRNIAATDEQSTKVSQQIDLYYERVLAELQQQREVLKNKVQEIAAAQKKTSISQQLEQICIKDSPYSMMVRQNYKSIDKPIRIVSLKMCGPSFIAFASDGIWAVADQDGNCVRIFDGEDQFIRKFGSHEGANCQFFCPRGIAFDSNDHLYVSDFSNHTVQKFTINGDYLLQFSHDEILCPSGIAIHNDRVYVSGARNISVFDLNGQFCCIIQSRHIWDVTIGANEHLLVADSDDISSYTLDGTYVGKFNKVQLSKPRGLTTDMHGFVLVTDNKNRVTVLDQDGDCICRFGYSSPDDEYYGYCGIAISPSGIIYVVDRENQKILMF